MMTACAAAGAAVNADAAANETITTRIRKEDGSGMGLFCSARLGQSNTKPPGKRKADEVNRMEKTIQGTIVRVWTAIDP